jgi:asparagine synthase (glutamine-hydrolysing)
MLNAVLVEGPRQALPMLLQKIERPHAAFAMRTTSPFTDGRMLELSARIPSRFKNDGLRNKRIFRDAMRTLLPAELVRLPKHAQRVRETVRFCDALEELTRRWLSPESYVRSELVEEDTVRGLLVRPHGGLWPPEHAMRLWTLVGVEIWAKSFLHGDGSQPVGAHGHP